MVRGITVLLGTLMLAALLVGAAVVFTPQPPRPSQQPLLSTAQPLPATPEPTRITERNGTMTVSQVRQVGLLITAIVTVTGDLEREVGDWIFYDRVAYHADHTVAAGVDASAVPDSALRIERLPSGGQRATLWLPESAVYFTQTNETAGIALQERGGVVTWYVPAPWVGSPTGLTNVATTDAQRLARRAVCQARLTVYLEDGPVEVTGITRAAALLAQDYWRRLLYAAQYEEVLVYAPVGVCE